MAIMKPGATSFGGNRLMLNIYETMTALKCSRGCVFDLIKTSKLITKSVTNGVKTELQITRASVDLITPDDIRKIIHCARYVIPIHRV